MFLVLDAVMLSVHDCLWILVQLSYCCAVHWRLFSAVSLQQGYYLLTYLPATGLRQSVVVPIADTAVKAACLLKIFCPRRRRNSTTLCQVTSSSCVYACRTSGVDKRMVTHVKVGYGDKWQNTWWEVCPALTWPSVPDSRLPAQYHLEQRWALLLYSVGCQRAYWGLYLSISFTVQCYA